MADLLKSNYLNYLPVGVYVLMCVRETSREGKVRKRETTAELLEREI